ncbi:hypothetical protein GCM10009000_008770 [Halobacterium noricense]|uniref:Glutamine synthetase n=1 Tax=Haladaptatus pallidirubidus TaxID=1008152 RepID=A0AAV3UQ69_9EURY
MTNGKLTSVRETELTTAEQDIVDAIDTHNADIIRLQFTDITGTDKNVSIPASQVEKAFKEKNLVRRFLNREIHPNPGERHAARTRPETLAVPRGNQTAILRAPTLFVTL